VRQPFNVNGLAQVAALAALEDQAFIAESVRINREGMQQLSQGFATLGLDFIPSVGNFISVALTRPALEVDQALLREGCIVRPIGGYGMPNHLRVSIGMSNENARLLTALQKVLTG
jgi:histidinol-phosphate aminotransferase